MSKDIELAERWEKINKVVEEYLKGNTPTQIAKSTGYTRNQVQEYISEWQQVIWSDRQIQERAKSAIMSADQHFNMLIQSAWETLDQADQVGNLGAKTTSIKIISDIESKRIDILQKAGLLNNNELAMQIAEAEERQEVLIKILREVSSKCDNCKVEVAKRLSQASGQAEVIETNG
jgi:hypothetical protein